MSYSHEWSAWGYLHSYRGLMGNSASNYGVSTGHLALFSVLAMGEEQARKGWGGLC